MGLEDDSRWWGIWFTNGEHDWGWLSRECGNGRECRSESSKEHAEEQARFENEHRGGRFVFKALPVDMPSEEFKIEIEKLRQEARAKQRARWA